MKIYFDGIIYSWQTGGGVYRYFEEIIKRCAKQKDIGATLVLQVPTYGTTHKKSISIKSVIPLGAIPSLFFGIMRKILSPVNRILLENYFKNISTGVFHSTYYTTYKNLKIPQVLTVHDMTHEKFPHFFSTRGARRFIANKKKCILSADSIICISEATKKALIEIYNIEDKKISVIYHGISKNFKSDATRVNNEVFNKPYFLFVGHRGLYKNFLFFIEAFSKWSKNKDYNILLIGGNKLSRKEMLIINDLGLIGQIKYLGFIEENRLKYIYQQSKALVFPSLDEGFGFPILEALSSKTQVLASKIEAFEEIGEDMLIYFDPRRIESLIYALDQSVSKDFSGEEAERRANYVSRKFNWDECFRETLEVYHKTINEKKN